MSWQFVHKYHSQYVTETLVIEAKVKTYTPEILDINKTFGFCGRVFYCQKYEIHQYPEFDIDYSTTYFFIKASFWAFPKDHEPTPTFLLEIENEYLTIIPREQRYTPAEWDSYLQSKQSPTVALTNDEVLLL
jgi:hypothetical protein